MENPNTSTKQNENGKNDSSKTGWTKISVLGVILFVAFMVALLLIPEHVAGLFTAMAEKAFTNGFNIYLMTNVGAGIVVSVIIGRLLERGGVTDGLVKLFTPFAKVLKMNPTTLVPGLYNFLGDVNAAGRITAPILQNAKTTIDEKKIAIATMLQLPPAFGAFLYGIKLLAVGEINAFFVVVLGCLIPLFLVPLVLRFTLYRKCEYKDVMSEIPSFTPSEKNIVDTVFDGAIEGADVLIRLILPTTCAIFAIVAALEYFSVWPFIEKAFMTLLQLCNIEPTTGMRTLLISGAVGQPALIELIGTGVTVAPNVIVASMLFGSSCMQFVLPLCQVPIVWKKNTDLTFGQAIQACLVSWVVRMIWIALVSYLIVPILY